MTSLPPVCDHLNWSALGFDNPPARTPFQDAARRLRAWILWAAVLGRLSAGPPVSAGEDTKKPLIWAADADGGAPYIYKDPQDPQRNIGFEVDLAKALARELGRPIQFKQYQFHSLVSGLQRGDFDLAMNGLEVTPDRRTKLLFSHPYYIFQQQLVVRTEESRFQNLEDIQKHPGVTVGTMEDTAPAAVAVV